MTRKKCVGALVSSLLAMSIQYAKENRCFWRWKDKPPFILIICSWEKSHWEEVISKVGKGLAKVYSSQYLLNQYLLSIKYVLGIQFSELETLYSYKTEFIVEGEGH